MNRMDDLLKDFTSGADRVEKNLSTMLALVSGGRVPPKAEMLTLEKELDGLQKAYESIQLLAFEVAEKGELPGADASVTDYAEVIRRSEHRRVKEQLAEIENRLHRFISVKSLVVAFEDALKPYQEAAQEMLCQLDRESVPLPHEWESATQGPKLFLEALTTEDFDSDVGLELMERLEAHYPSKVQRGLMLNKYYEGESAGEVAKAGAEQQPTPAAEESGVSRIVKEEINAAPDMVDAAKTKTESQKAEGEPVPDSAAEVTGKETAEESDSPKMVQANAKIKVRSASASTFKNEILRVSHSVCTILPLFTNLGALTAKQIYAFGCCLDCFDPLVETKEEIDKALEALVSKSFIASYSLDSCDEPIYCLTAFGYESLTKRSIAVDLRRIFTLSFGKYRLIGKDEMHAVALLYPILHNASLLMYLCHMRDSLDENMYDSVKKSVVWDGMHYTVSVFTDDGEYTCFVCVSLDNYAALQEEGNILIYAEDVSTIDVPKSGANKVFAYDSTAVYMWDGAWVKQTSVLCDDSAPDGECDAFEEAKDALDELPRETLEAEKLPDASESAEVSAAEPAAEVLPIPSGGNGATVEETADTAAAEVSFDSAIPAAESPTPPQTNLVAECVESSMPTDDGTALGLCDLLLAGGADVTDEQFLELIHRLVADSATDTALLKEAVLLAKTAAFGAENRMSRCAYDQLALATNIGIDKTIYSGSVIADAFDRELDFTESCRLAAYLYSMLFPHQAYDHTLRATMQGALVDFEFVFPHYSGLKSLFNTAVSVCDISPEGFSESILAALSDQDKSSAHTEKLKRIAKPLLNEPKIKAHVTGIPEFTSSCFGKQSDLYLCMEIIAENHTDEKEFVAAVFAEYCESGADGVMISDLAIDSKIDREWKIATREKKTKGINLEYQGRKQVFNEFVQRLDLIKTWLKYSQTADTANIPAMKKRKGGLIKEICLAKETLQSSPQPYDAIVLWMLDEVQAKLENQERGTFVFDHLLKTGLIPVDDSGIPVLAESMHAVKYAEPWRTVMKHIAAEKTTLEAAKDRIFDSSSPTFDNLHQLEMIGKCIGSEDDDYVVTDTQISEAIETANARTEQFKDELELAYTYNRIYEVEKESLVALIDLYHDFYFEQKDFGCWRNFLSCLQQQVEDLSNERKRSLKIRLDDCTSKLRTGEPSSLLDEAFRLFNEDANFAVAEEYCNRFEQGERELTEELSLSLHDPDSFSEFISDEVFQPLYEECMRKSGSRLDKFGLNYIASRYPAGWTSRHKDDSKKLLSVWPSRRGQTTPDQIASFFAGLGFAVRGAEKVPGKKQEVFRLNIEPVVRNMPDYIHPIAAFGTQIKSPLNVVVLYGKNMSQELVDTINSLNIGGMSVVLIDYPLDRSARRQIAEIIHTKMSGMNPFLLIDQVLALHLALHQDTERLPVMLKCTLPYTSYQPFVRDGGPTADEMFCGRAGELSTIIDPNGACVVYGGRQLGKTALLERAQSLFAKPEVKAFAVYSNIVKLKSEAAVVERLVLDINRLTNIKVAECATLRELCAQIDALFRNGTISSMLLLIDEADDFLAFISAEDYLPLQPLVDLKRESKNQFKFVLAGLHNVCRAKNATARNGIFGQLGQPLCVKPLSPTDALQLISRPLKYLGFQVDRYPHLETILTNTNYYPGILQFFGYTLVQTMTSQYGKYYRAVDGNPPYTLKDEQLGAILNSADLNNSIKDKFRWSLELDPRYFMLARCIAMLYHENKGEPASSQSGFSVEQIQEMATVLEIHCLEDETSVNVANLLDEMIDMGILSRPNEREKRYRLRRRSFLNYFGADVNAILDDILKNNGEDE